MSIFLGLGSNLGDRLGHLQDALAALENRDSITVIRESSYFETEAVGPVAQPDFLNAAVEIQTALRPEELLDEVKGMEQTLGRQEGGVRWGPRVIDIDIILWDDMVLDTPRLTIPHKEFRNRAFVLQPLAELAPEAVDPVTGQTVLELAEDKDLCGRIKRVERIRK